SISHFFFSDTAPTSVYSLSLHDARPISREGAGEALTGVRAGWAIEPRNHHFGVPTLSHEAEGHNAVSVSARWRRTPRGLRTCARAEEHTSELQSRSDRVCRLLLENNKSG